MRPSASLAKGQVAYNALVPSAFPGSFSESLGYLKTAQGGCHVIRVYNIEGGTETRVSNKGMHHH